VVTEEQRYGPHWLRDNDDERNTSLEGCSHSTSVPRVCDLSTSQDYVNCQGLV